MKNLIYRVFTILILCPGVVVISQVHSLRLGYLLGQLGLVISPTADSITCLQPAKDKNRQNTYTDKIAPITCRIINMRTLGVFNIGPHLLYTPLYSHGGRSHFDKCK